MRGLTLAIALSAAAPAFAAPEKLLPVDQCRGEASFVAFRTSLSAAVERRDSKALIDLLAPDVLVNFGGDSGPAAFIQQWDPAKKDSKLWPAMDRLLRLGCALSGSARIMPSIGAQFEGDEDDIFDLVLVSDPQAKLRETSEPDAPAVALLFWDVVRPLAMEGDRQTRVRMADGREGWVFTDQLYSPLDYRIVAEKKAGRWMITAFVAGD